MNGPGSREITANAVSVIAFSLSASPVLAEEAHPEYGTVISIGMSQASVAFQTKNTICILQIWEQRAYASLSAMCWVSISRLLSRSHI